LSGPVDVQTTEGLRFLWCRDRRAVNFWLQVYLVLYLLYDAGRRIVSKAAAKTNLVMKKRTKTTTKALTPATKPAKTVKKTTARPAVKKTAPKVALTTISALIDVGFGNTLYLRGEGPGLSWETGIPMDCIADEHWRITVPESTRPIVFKFLLNDETWCAGDDYTTAPGSTVALTPEF